MEIASSRPTDRTKGIRMDVFVFKTEIPRNLSMIMGKC